MKVSKELLERVEQDVILRGADRGLITVQRNKIVPLRDGKLLSTEFGTFLGRVFKSDALLAINYYGHYKLSEGIEKAVASVQNIFAGIRSIKADIIHFNSIRTESAKDIAKDDHELFIGYVELKKYLLGLRFGDD